MPDTAFTTKLVVLGNDGTNGVVWAQTTSATMAKILSADDLPKEKTIAVIPAYQKVFFAASSAYRYANFTAATPTWNVWAAASGSMPGDANIGCLYRGRIVLAGDSSDPNMWYMSRQGTYDCWTYGSTDAQSAVAGGNAEAAKTPDLITCVAPYSDDYLVMGGSHTVHLLRGDPCAGGVIDLILGSDGIFGPDAWCLDSMGNMFFVATAGLYKMDRGGSIPKPLNNTTIPNMMDGIDRDTYRATLGYDAQRHGLLLSFTKLADGTGTHYWYDLRTGGFFPESYIAGMGPYSQAFFDSDDKNLRGLLLGCSDGYIRWFDDSQKSDEGPTGTAVKISSKVLMGPIDLSMGNRTGKVTELDTTLGSDTDGATYDVYGSNSAEELLDVVQTASVPAGLYSGTYTGGGRQNSVRVKVRGAALAVKLTNTTISESFAVEKLAVQIKESGRLKKI